jgi:S-adenosylmethionine/arginine decarboxylase-like enzyme
VWGSGAMSNTQNKIDSREIIGKELLLDLDNCDILKFSRNDLSDFLKNLCKHINMTATEQFCWEYLDDPNRDEDSMTHLAGHSFVQFLMTSNITLHSFDNSRKISLNIYSCKDFNEEDATEYCKKHFNGNVLQAVTLLRY